MKKQLTNPIQQITTKMSSNGIKCANIQCVDGSFIIQTNGNLPRTHRDGVYTWSADEVYSYVKKHGTARQKRICTQELI